MTEQLQDAHRIPVGGVAYYVYRDWYSWKVRYGIVEEYLPSVVCLQLLEKPSGLLINGIPEKDTITPTKWQKLPKGWTWDTQLFEKSYTPFPEKLMKCNFGNPQEVLELYRLGMLVKAQDNDPAEIESEIDGHLGWRIVRKVGHGSYNPSHASVMYHECYETYAEAKAMVEAHEAELKRQSELSPREWSIEQIDHVLSIAPDISDLTRQKYREWLLSQDHVEDIDVRYGADGLQWKYGKKKTWMSIEAE